MPYRFFLSYTRANNDAYLQQFVRDLRDVIRDRVPEAGEVGFFDQRELELGEDWDAAIVQALQASAVMVPVFSPAFFRSDYCGKELELFRARCAASVPAGQPLPPLIKPVIWVPFKPTDVPAPLSVGQFTFGDPQAVQNVKGFKYLLKQLQEYRTTYNDLLENLAGEILDAATRYPLPSLAEVPKLRDVVSLFHAEGAPGRPAPPAPSRVPAGPKHVRFVYIAADPQMFGNARIQDAYLDLGGADWKPFFPASKTRVHRFVQSVVSNDELDFTSEELPFTANLLAEIDEAWNRRHIVVLVVDGWSLHWSQQYRDVLSNLDRRLDYHWCVLVPWNEDDHDSVANRAQIEAAVNNTFDRHANLAPNPMFYRDKIRSAEDFKKTLIEVLTKLKAEIRKRAPVAMPIPSGPSKAELSGPAAQG